MNEIDKIKYLFGYKKGVVISEQAIPPPPPDTPTTPVPPSPETSPVTTTTTTVKPISPDKLRDCAGFNSGGKLTKGEETDEFTIFNNEKGIPVCKKPK
jgi:hypothetical protein